MEGRQGGSNHHPLRRGNQYELNLLASLTLVIVPWNNEIAFKVKHDRHNNYCCSRSWRESEGETNMVCKSLSINYTYTSTALKIIGFLRPWWCSFKRSVALIPIKANLTRAEQSRNPGTFVLSAANPLTALREQPTEVFFCPLCGVSTIEAPRGAARPSSTFSFVWAHRLCRSEGRGGHLKSTPLIHHTRMQCTYRMSNRESTKEHPPPLPPPPPRPSMWDVKPRHWTLLRLHWLIAGE